MSISGISGQNYFSNAIYNQQNNRQQMQTDFAQLGQDLQSGNLTQAQSDYTNIQSLQQSMQANSNSSSQSLQSIQSLISQYMQNMLTGMNNQESQAGALGLTNLNLTI